jgi:isopenicillin-N N-acyltransferase-like protein
LKASSRTLTPQRTIIIGAVTTPHTIPVVRLEGTYAEVGAQIGELCADTIRRSVDFDAELPAGRTRAHQLELAARYRDVTADAMPWAIEEIEAAAEAAGVHGLDLFACHIEEIWYEPRGCSDLVAAPPLTADGHVWVAHTNDMPRRYQDELVAIDRRIPGDPAVFTIGNGIDISVGWNDAGLSLTGNELSPNDERVGIPREIQVRAMLRDRSLDAMIGTAIRHDRASSYNNVLASADGRVVNVEGSATDVEMTEPQDGRLVHTNHYVCESMLRYEGDPGYAEHSAVRYRRAGELLGAAAPGSVGPDRLREILADHEHAPDSLCRHEHEAQADPSVTCFWCVADVSAGRVIFGRGNPCDSVPQEYAFEDYPAAVA